MYLNDINYSDTVLIIFEEDADNSIVQEIKKITQNVIGMKVTDNITSKIPQTSQSVIILQLNESKINSDLFKSLLTLNKPGGKLIIDKITDINNIEFLLKTTGYTNIDTKTTNMIVCHKPKYAIGSTAKLNLSKPKATVWKLDGDDDDDDDETIDPDNLLDDDDLKKPDPSSLRVCGTTGKRKACKDCSCGLADELAAEAQSGKVIDTSNAPKSSCGSCYLGDAFRCASCPYLGMPAFKPGEKVQLTDNLLKSDV